MQGWSQHGGSSPLPLGTPLDAKGKKEDERGERGKEPSLVLKKKIIASSCGSAGGVLLVLLIVLAACVLWCRRRKNRKGVSTLEQSVATLHTMAASTSPLTSP